MRQYALYRFRDADGRLLYVGQTSNFGRRLQQHRNTKPWIDAVTRIDVEWFEFSNEARAAEAHAIESEHPLYNVPVNEASAKAWSTRRETQDRLHAAGGPCHVASCRRCAPIWAANRRGAA